MEFPDIYRHGDVIGYDTESTGLSHIKDRVFGLSVATAAGSWYYDIRETPQAVDWINDQMSKFKGRVVAHKAGFDYKMSHATGIKIPLDQMDCTIVRACNIDEHLREYNLDELASIYLGQHKVNSIYQNLALMFGGKAARKSQMPNLHRAPSSLVRPYAEADARLVLELWNWQEEEIRRQDAASPRAKSLNEIMEFERSLIPVITRMEMRGIRVDVNAAQRAMEDLTPLIWKEQAELNHIAGFELNVNSSPQVKKLFAPQFKDGRWMVGDVECKVTTKGNPSIDAEVLRMIKHPAAEKIMSIRSLIKTRDTFLAKHVLGHEIDGRVYPSINQTKNDTGGTGTGRLSYQDPAMQQIPSRNKEVASIVKPTFLPEEGHEWVDVDESSFEVRIFAHLVGRYDRNIIETYRRNPRTDFHQWAADLTGLPRSASYSGQPNAKQLSLSAIFNSGDGAIANKMGMEWEWSSFETDEGEIVTYRKPGIEARGVIARYHAELPGVKILQRACKETAERRGFIFTERGRRIRFPNRRKAYKASGLLIQCTAADFNKENLAIFDDYFSTTEGHLLLNTHDSYSFSVPEGTARDHWIELRASLEADGRARVPLLMDVSGAGKNWWDALNDTHGLRGKLS